MNVLLYNHGTSYNHGCEAIVRTVSAIISEKIPDAKFTVSSIRPQEDLEYFDTEDGKFTFVRSDDFTHLSFEKRRLIVGSSSTVLHNIPFFNHFFRETVGAAKKADIMISIGGDTFSYGKSAELTTVSNKLRRYCDKSVLWGCSIDPKVIVGKEFKYKTDGLKRFSLITARESLTYQSVTGLGFENVKLYPDPAFVLKSKEPAEPLFDNDCDIVGINISPLIISHEKEPGITLKAYAALVKKLLEKTSFNIALISHVICKTTNDTEAARRLVEVLGESDRIRIFDKGNAEELKGIISKCRFFVAARTHASISAYSQSIPTLVVGYSVKAKGIARDLFGDHKGYVIPVQDLAGTDQLSDAFDFIVKNEESIRARYDAVLPEYKRSAIAAGDEIVRLMGREKEAKW